MISSKSNKRKHEEEPKKKKKKTKKPVEKDTPKLQDETSILLNALVTKLPEDNAQVSAVVIKASVSSSSSESSSSMEEEEEEDAPRQQIVPYQQQTMNVTEPVLDMNSVNASKLLDLARIMVADNKYHQAEALRYAKKKSTNKELIKIARLNGDHKASKLEGRLEFATEEIKKKDDELARKDKRIATLEAELKKKDESVIRNQRIVPPSSHHHNTPSQTDNTNDVNNNCNKNGDDSLTASNMPYLAHAVGDGNQLDKSIAMLVHCRKEIAELNFGSTVNAIVVPVSGIYNFAQLMPFLTGHALTRDTPIYNAIAQVGIYLKSNCYPIVPIQQPGCNDLNGYAYDETNTEANRYNLAVITQTLCTQELINHFFTVLCVGEPSANGDDSDEEEEIDEMFLPVSRVKKSVKKSAKQQAIDEKKITRLYDPAFQTNAKMTAIMSHIPHIEGLPLVSPHFTSFMALPVKPDYIGKSKSQGGWKECSMCGSHCTFQQKTRLSNHIPKSCPFCLVVCASFQAELVAREKFKETFSVKTSSIVTKFIRQMNVCDEEFKKIRPLIASKYTKFFDMTNTTVPSSFSATLIDCHADPYNKSDLERALNTTINAGRSATFDYRRHAEEYRMAHNDDVRMAMNVTDQYTHTKYRREQIIAEVFRKSLVVAVPLQTRGAISICRRAVDDLLLKRDGASRDDTPVNTTSTTTTQQPTNGSTYMDREMDKCSAYSGVINASTSLYVLKSQYESLESHRDNEIRLNGSVDELNLQLEEMRAQIATKEQEVAMQQTSYDNYICQSNQVSFNATPWSQLPQQQPATNVFQMQLTPQEPMDFASYLRTLGLPPLDSQENNNNNVTVTNLPQQPLVENNNNAPALVVQQEVPIHNEQPAVPLGTPFLFSDELVFHHEIPEQMLGESDKEYKDRIAFY